MTAASTNPQVGEGSNSHIFWRFWTAGTVSNCGSAVTKVALPLVAVLVLQSSSAQVGSLTAAETVAWLLLGLPAGVIVGRFPLRGTQVAMDLGRAAAIVSVPLAAALHVLSFWQLLLVALLTGLANVIFDVGNSTFLPSITSKEELTRRNSLYNGSYAATELGAPSLAGLLVQAIGAAACLLIDAVSYVISAIFLWTLPRPAQPAPAEHVRTATLIREGLGYVLRHKTVLPCVIAAALVNMTCGALMTLAPLYLVRYLRTPVGLYGIIIAAEGAGGMLGATAAAFLQRRFGSARAVLLATTCGGLAVLLLPLSGRGPALISYAVGSVVFTMGVAILSILTRSHRQAFTPRELLPRVMATVRFISWGTVPVGAIASGLLATATGIHVALWLACVPALLVPVILWLSPVRGQRDLS